MATGSPGAGNEEKYDAWYPLLEKELGLVAKPVAKIISVGSRMDSFLSNRGLYGHVGTIPHYSGQAAGHRGQEISGRGAESERFQEKLGAIPSWTHRPYHSCDARHEALEVTPTATEVKLLFDYKVRFERIRQQEQTGWRQHQREWQRRLDARQGGAMARSARNMHPRHFHPVKPRASPSKQDAHRSPEPSICLYDTVRSASRAAEPPLPTTPTPQFHGQPEKPGHKSREWPSRFPFVPPRFHPSV